MTQDHFILDDEHHVVAVDLMTWARWLEDFKKRRVAETFTKFYRVSTVFLGLDHNFGGKGPPILFETMVFTREPTIKKIFGRRHSIHEEADDLGLFNRYASWDDAEAGHNAYVRLIERWEAEGLAAAQFLREDDLQ